MSDGRIDAASANSVLLLDSSSNSYSYAFDCMPIIKITFATDATEWLYIVHASFCPDNTVTFSKTADHSIQHCKVAV